MTLLFLQIKTFSYTCARYNLIIFIPHMPPKNSELTQSQKKKFKETSAAGTPGQSNKKKPTKKKYSTLLSLLVISLIF